METFYEILFNSFFVNNDRNIIAIKLKIKPTNIIFLFNSNMKKKIK